MIIKDWRILGNDTVHKLNSDLFENLRAIYDEQNNKDSLINYKKDLKLKFNFHGEINDEVV